MSFPPLLLIWKSSLDELSSRLLGAFPFEEEPSFRILLLLWSSGEDGMSAGSVKVALNLRSMSFGLQWRDRKVMVLDRHLVDQRRQSERDVIRGLSQLPQLAVEHYLVEVAGLVEDASCAGGQQQYLAQIDVESDGPIPLCVAQFDNHNIIVCDLSCSLSTTIERISIYIHTVCMNTNT